MQNISNGQIRNPFAKNAFGGWLGLNNEYRSKKYKWLYNIWFNMLKDIHYDRSKSINVLWLDYSNFASWYMNEYNQRNQSLEEGYMVSCSVLYNYYKQYTNGYREYSSQTCELVPRYFDISQIDYYKENNYISERLWNILKHNEEFYL